MAYDSLGLGFDPSLSDHILDFEARRGRIIGVWADLETVIDQAHHYAWHYSGKRISKVVPQGLRWKTELFEQIHVKVLPFGPLRERAAVLIGFVRSRLNDRHWLAHGVLLPKECDSDSWTVLKNDFRKDGSIKALRRRFTPAELDKLSSDLAALARDLTSYTDALVPQILSHTLDN